jgi:hypothetical protein
LHWIRSRLVRQRTGVSNQIRGFPLERGIHRAPGACALAAGPCQGSWLHPLTRSRPGWCA